MTLVRYRLQKVFDSCFRILTRLTKESCVASLQEDGQADITKIDTPVYIKYNARSLVR